MKAQEKGGRTPMHYAAMDGHVDVVRLLLEKGADVKAQEKGGGHLCIMQQGMDMLMW